MVKGGLMPKMTLRIPLEIKNIISQYPEINWEMLAKDAIWNYARKLHLADKIVKKSRLKFDDVEILDREIKKSLIKKYRSKRVHK